MKNFYQSPDGTLTVEISAFGIATVKENGKLVTRFEADENTIEWYENEFGTIENEIEELEKEISDIDYDIELIEAYNERGNEADEWFILINRKSYIQERLAELKRKKIA